MRRPGYLGDLSDTWFGAFAGRKKRERKRPKKEESKKEKEKSKKGREKPKKGRRARRARRARQRAGEQSGATATGNLRLTHPDSARRNLTCGTHPLVANSPRRADLLKLCSHCIGPHNPGGSIYNIVTGRDNLPEVVCMVNKGSYHQPTRFRLAPTAADQVKTAATRQAAVTGCAKFTGAWRYGMGACKQCIAQGGKPSPHGTPATPTHAGSTSVYCDIPGRGRVVLGQRGQVAQRGVGPTLR